MDISLINRLLSWDIIGWIVGLAIPLGFGFVAMSDYRLAKLCFAIAGIVLATKAFQWGIYSLRPLSARVIVGCVWFSFAGMFTVLTFRYVDQKEIRASQESQGSSEKTQAAKARPTASAESQHPKAEQIPGLTMAQLFEQWRPTETRYGDSGQTFNRANDSPVLIKGAVFLDDTTKMYYIAYHVPPVAPYTVRVIKDLASRYDFTERVMERFRGMKAQGSRDPKPTGLGVEDKPVFSKLIVIYYEEPLTLNQKAEIEREYQSRGLSVQFRGLDYLLDENMRQAMAKEK